MFRKIHSIAFALGIQSQQAKRIDREHDYQGDAESRDGRDTASDRLGDQELRATAVKETCQRRTVIWSERSGGSIFPCGKESERKGAPYAAQPMYRPGADWIVDAQVFEKFHARYDDKTSDSSRRMDPVGLTQ